MWAASVNANDQLVIVDTSQGGTKTVATLQLTGNYRGQTFNTRSNGGGGTDVMLASDANQKSVSAGAAETLPLQTFVASIAGMGPRNFPQTPVSHGSSEIPPTLISPRIHTA